MLQSGHPLAASLDKIHPQPVIFQRGEGRRFIVVSFLNIFMVNLFRVLFCVILSRIAFSIAKNYYKYGWRDLHLSVRVSIQVCSVVWF